MFSDISITFSEAQKWRSFLVFRYFDLFSRKRKSRRTSDFSTSTRWWSIGGRLGSRCFTGLLFWWLFFYIFKNKEVKSLFQTSSSLINRNKIRIINRNKTTTKVIQCRISIPSGLFTQEMRIFNTQTFWENLLQNCSQFTRRG